MLVYRRAVHTHSKIIYIINQSGTREKNIIQQQSFFDYRTSKKLAKGWAPYCKRLQQCSQYIYKAYAYNLYKWVVRSQRGRRVNDKYKYVFFCSLYKKYLKN